MKQNTLTVTVSKCVCWGKGESDTKGAVNDARKQREI